MSLVTLLGKEEMPKVADVIKDAKDAKIKGNFAKVTSKDKDYYFVANDAQKIDDNPDDYRVIFSANHDALFIVPNSGGGFSGKF